MCLPHALTLFVYFLYIFSIHLNSLRKYKRNEGLRRLSLITSQLSIVFCFKMLSSFIRSLKIPFSLAFCRNMNLYFQAKTIKLRKYFDPSVPARNRSTYGGEKNFSDEAEGGWLKRKLLSRKQKARDV